MASMIKTVLTIGACALLGLTDIKAQAAAKGEKNDLPLQVEITCMFIEMGINDMKQLGIDWVQGGPVSSSSDAAVLLNALKQKEGVNILALPKLITKSGANAEVKSVTECIYPTKFSVMKSERGPSPQAVAPTNMAVQGATPLPPPPPRESIIPSEFQTRDVGAIMNVTPTIGPDRNTLDLVMLPQVCRLAGWIDYGTPGRKMVQPVFQSFNITTSVTIISGQTIMLGANAANMNMKWDERGLAYTEGVGAEHGVLIFVTARIIGPSAEPVKK